MEQYIIFDIGGTFIKWAIIDAQFKLYHMDKFAFAAQERNCQIEMVAQIIAVIEEQQVHFPNLKGIGIATAGDVDPHEFEIIGAVPNHKQYIGTNYKKAFAKYLAQGWKLIVINDANAAVLGEHAQGQLQDVSDAIMLTLGTDIGCGILINNQLFSGYHGTAGEVGYQNVLNRRYGTYFSAIGLGRLAQEFQLTTKTLEPVTILKNENHLFDELIEYWYQGLAIGISNLICMFGPQKIILGGGLSEAKILDLNRIQTIINQNLIEPHLIASYQLELALHGNLAAIHGCTVLLNQQK